MAKKTIATGVVHEVPEDLYQALVNDESALERRTRQLRKAGKLLAGWRKKL